MNNGEFILWNDRFQSRDKPKGFIFFLSLEEAIKEQKYIEYFNIGEFYIMSIHYEIGIGRYNIWNLNAKPLEIVTCEKFKLEI